MSSKQIAVLAGGIMESLNGNTINIQNEQQQWHNWLETNTSFRYCPEINAPAYTVRKERSKRGQVDYWYGYRKVDGRLHKKYVGKTEDLTVGRLEAIATDLSNPSTEPKKVDSGYRDVYVTEGERLLENKAWIAQSNFENVRDENEDLKQKLNQALAAAEKLAQERDELDQEVDRLSAKVGDLDLEKQNLADQLGQTQAELEKVRSQSSEPTVTTELPEPAELLNQLRKTLPKSKISLREVETLLELL